MKLRTSILTAVCVFVFSTGVATASPLLITDVGDLPGNGWIDPLPLSAVTVQNQPGQLTDLIYWGGYDDVNSNSAYQFTPLTPLNPVMLYMPFLLGDFLHVNKPVPGDSLTSVSYSFGFATNGVPNSVNTVFQFIHDETLNTGPCPANPVTNAASISDCDDFVTLANLMLNESVTVGGDTYFFSLLGFSTDGGTTFSQVLQTQENRNTSASLYGVVTTERLPEQPVPVPEPASILLLGTGVAGLVTAARRRRS